MRRRTETIAAGPRSMRTGQRSQWITERPASSRITGVLLTEAPAERRPVARRAEAARVAVLADRHPAAGRTAREVVTPRRHRSQIEARVTAVTTDHHAATYL